MTIFNKQEFETKYKQINKVFCPFFGENIAFDSNGLHHLYNNGTQNQRSAEELSLRCKLSLLVPKFLVENIGSSTLRLREYSNRSDKFEKYWSFVVGYESRTFGKNEHKDDFYIKFLVRQTDTKPKHFYSVMLINSNKKLSTDGKD